jgi:beta-galactosidase/beta-glucuronidase
MKLLNTVTLLLLVLLATGLRAATTIDLSGEWQVNLQAPAGADSGWRPIRLPGTLTDAGIGEPLKLRPELTLATLARLQTTFSYVGPAWYRRSIDVPMEWAGRRIVLEIERVLWTSQVWVDGRYMGRADSLSAPHMHDLSVVLTPGRHELLVQIDNREIHPGISHRATSYPAAADAFLAHAYTNHTQTLWNGMLGTLRLRSEPQVALRNLAVFPRRQPTAGLRIEGQLSGASADGAGAAFEFVLRKPSGEVLAQRTETLGAAGGTTVAFDWDLPKGADVEPWDEYSPALYRLEVRSAKGEAVAQDIRFGFRDVKAEGGELRLNGRRLFLRGTLECAVFR